MRLRTFTAPDMQRAMVMIRETLGDDAVIIATTRENGGKNVSVTAALDEEFGEPIDDTAYDEAPPEPAHDEEPDYDLPTGGLSQYLAATAKQKQQAAAPTHSQPLTPPLAPRQKAKAPLMSHDAIMENRDLAYLLHEIEQIFNFHCVPSSVIEKLLRAGKHLDPSFANSQDGGYEALVDLLTSLYGFAPLHLEEMTRGKAQRVMLVGPPGVGKTLAVAKIAANMVADGLPIHVITIDNKRAGSVEQLRAFTNIMGLEAEVADSRAELRQLLRDCPADEPVIIDSFGTNPYSFDELKELTDFANLHDIEPVLVLSAGSDAQEAADIAKAFCFLNIHRLLVTRTDTARRLGAMLSAADACELSLCNMTTNPQVAGGFSELNAETLSHVLLQHKQDH